MSRFRCWTWLGVMVIIGSSVTTVESQRTFLDTVGNIQLLRDFRTLMSGILGRKDRDLQLAREQNRTQAYYKDPFPCNIYVGGRSSEVPKSVHKLRPGDIDVIGAMGDSITAGLAVFATSVLQLVAIENRGVVACAGGQGTWREFLTVPNILKEFNPNLFGYAASDSFTFNKASEFNVAEIGALSKDMPYMAQAIINRMKSDPRVNMKKHWKMITLMIGANDFCHMCYLPETTSMLSDHKNDLLQTLRLLRDQLPRTFVSIIPPPQLKVLVDIKGRSRLCELNVAFECPCLFGLAYRKQRKKYYDIMTSWQKLEEEISQYPEFQRDDFAVTFQPFPTNLTYPVASNGLSDLTYLAIDCFHISQKGNARTANALWNNLMQPVGRKSRTWTETFKEFVCPTKQRPYIATINNSRN